MAAFIDDGYTVEFNIGDGALLGRFRPRSRQQWRRWSECLAPSSPRFDTARADRIAAEVIADQLIEWSSEREITIENVQALAEPIFDELVGLVMVAPPEDAAKN